MIKDYPSYLYQGFVLDCMPRRTLASTWQAHAVITSTDKGADLRHELALDLEPFTDVWDAIEQAQTAAMAWVNARARDPGG